MRGVRGVREGFDAPVRRGDGGPLGPRGGLGSRLLPASVRAAGRAAPRRAPKLPRLRRDRFASLAAGLAGSGVANSGSKRGR